MGWRVTIDQISGAGGRARFEYTSSGGSPVVHAVANALIEARLTDVVAGEYQITVTPASAPISSGSTNRFTGKHSIGEHLPGEAIPAQDIQHQLGVCPACGKAETVVNTDSDRFRCINVERGPGGILGCGAMWRGARLGVPS